MAEEKKKGGLFGAIRDAVFVSEGEQGAEVAPPPSPQPAAPARTVPPLRSATPTGGVSEEDAKMARDLVERLTKVTEKADLAAFLEAVRDLGEDMDFGRRVTTTLKLAARMKINVSGLLVDAGNVLATVEQTMTKAPDSLRANIMKIDEDAASQRAMSSSEIQGIDVEMQRLQSRRTELVQGLQSLDTQIEQAKAQAARRSAAIVAELQRVAGSYGQLVQIINATK